MREPRCTTRWLAFHITFATFAAHARARTHTRASIFYLQHIYSLILSSLCTNTHRHAPRFLHFSFVYIASRRSREPSHPLLSFVCGELETPFVPFRSSRHYSSHTYLETRWCAERPRDDNAVFVLARVYILCRREEKTALHTRVCSRETAVAFQFARNHLERAARTCRARRQKSSRNQDATRIYFLSDRS